MFDNERDIQRAGLHDAFRVDRRNYATVRYDGVYAR